MLLWVYKERNQSLSQRPVQNAHREGFPTQLGQRGALERFSK
jgi:hypothetical protein